MHTVSLTILVDNIPAAAPPGLLSEHGFALWIDTGDDRVLLDTGQGAALEHNARLLGVDLRRTDHLVLSHGHYDHTGALPAVVGVAPHVVVHGHPAIVEPRYALREGVAKSIAMPGASRHAVAALPAERMHWVQEPHAIGARAWITGPVPRHSAFEDTGGPFYLDAQGVRPDPIEDDMSLWIPSPQGLVVCLGCCHAGVVNTLRYITEITGEPRIRLVLGGMHLLHAGPDRLEQTIMALRTMDIAQMIACHCTGAEAIAQLRAGLPFPVDTGQAGRTVTVK